MASRTVTLTLEGDVSLEDFARAIDGLQRLMSALSSEVADQATIEWMVDALEAGNATATILGESETPEAVESVTQAFLEVGRLEESGSQIPYGRPVRAAISRIRQILDHGVTAIRFETADGECRIRNLDGPSETTVPVMSTWGGLTGRVHTLSSRGSLRFTLYDLLYSKPVPCHVEQGREDMMKGIWGRVVTVDGWVTRDAITGRPLSVRHIRSIITREEGAPGAFSPARGAVRHSRQAAVGGLVRVVWQLVRIGVVLGGVVVAAYGYQAYLDASQRVQVGVLPYWLLGLVLATFLLGVLVELIPFPRRLAPSSPQLVLSIVVLGLLVLLTTPVGGRALGLDPLDLPTLSAHPWVAATLSLLLGAFVARGLVRGERRSERP